MRKKFRTTIIKSVTAAFAARPNMAATSVM
jgi:hypothetical protein